MVIKIRRSARQLVAPPHGNTDFATDGNPSSNYGATGSSGERGTNTLPDPMKQVVRA